MPSPFSPRNLYPDLVGEVEAAYERNKELGRVIDDAFADDVAKGSLADLIKHETAEAREQGGLAGVGLEAITDPEVRARFERIWDIEGRVFEHISLPVPTAEQFADAGVDFARLADKYQEMLADNLEPQLVIAPQNLGLSVAHELYGGLTADTTIPNNPLQARSDGDGLWVSDEVAADWDTLIHASLPPNPSDGFLPRVQDGSGCAWTIRVIPGTDQPPKTSVTHGDDNANHPSIPEYLTLQATRIQAGESPIDNTGNTVTWLSGTFGDGNGQAPRGRWGSGGGRVDVAWNRASLSYDFLGSRLPVW